MFLMLYYINWPIFIVWLSLLLEILGSMCIAIVYFPGCDVINFEINLIFLIKPFLYIIIKSRQKFKYLGNKLSLYDEIKSIFHHFRSAISLRPESVLLTFVDKFRSLKNKCFCHLRKLFFPFTVNRQLSKMINYWKSAFSSYHLKVKSLLKQIDANIREFRKWSPPESHYLSLPVFVF